MSEYIYINNVKVRRSKRIAASQRKTLIPASTSLVKNKKVFVKSNSVLYDLFENSIFFILLNELDIILLLRTILLFLIIFAHFWFPFTIYSIIYELLDHCFVEEYIASTAASVNITQKPVITAIISKNFTDYQY